MYYTYGYGLYIVFHLLWWVLIAFFVIWIIRSLSHHDGSHHHFRNRWGKTALDLLKERYAKGEITKAEFDEKKKDIIES